MDYLSTTLAVLYYLAYPIFYILRLIVLVLATIAAPIIHLGHYILHACLYPLHILGKFETLYIYFGVAIVVGALTGTSLHYFSTFVITALQLERTREEKPGRSVAPYRAEKVEKQAKKGPLRKLLLPGRTRLKSDVAVKNELQDWQIGNEERGRGRNGRNGLIPNTILEEDDSSEVGF